MSGLNVATYCLGMWQTNSYVVSDPESLNCWIIDAGFEPGEMIEAIRSKGLTPELLIYTHAHLDHIAGTADIKKAFPDMKTAVSSAAASLLGDPAGNLSASMGMSVTADNADLELSDRQTLELGGYGFKIISTPGHSPGGICLYQPELKMLFAGDTLFQGSIGRYDFPGSSGNVLFESINTKLLVLPDETMVYPGHGGTTTIGEEKISNPFLNG